MGALANQPNVADITRNLLRARRPRTNQPVRRNSYNAGEREQRAWAQHNMFGRDENNARMRAAEAFDRRTKKAGKRNGALGHIALEVLRLLLKLRNRKTGQLDPSYAWIASELNRSRSAVVAAMHRLKANGFLDWIRRTQLVEDPDSDQYVEQIPNAYFFSMPRKVAELVARMLRRPTEEQRRRAAEAERDQRNAAAEAMSDADVDEMLASVADPQLRATLERLRATVGSANPSSGQNGAL